jgi:hypothetical protein
MPKVSARKPKRAPWQTARAAQARDAKNLGALDAMLRIFGEQVEPIYRSADRLVRARLKTEIGRRFEQIDKRAPAVADEHLEVASDVTSESSST